MPRLPRSFFRRDSETVARALLGRRLVRILPDGTRLAGLIVETEAYLGPTDRAAHSYNLRRTPRNEAMYADAGTAYVYFTYGMHYCFNVVCGSLDNPIAVLIRALEPTEGIEQMQSNRATDSLKESVPSARRARHLTSGPARLCQALRIDRALNFIDLATSNALFIERTRPIPPCSIAKGPRIGIDYAGPWARRHLRFWIKRNPFVSK